MRTAAPELALFKDCDLGPRLSQIVRARGANHTATDDNGAHFFDLLDIQKVLGHADPATTMRSYLDPMDTGVLDRAASLLD